MKKMIFVAMMVFCNCYPMDELTKEKVNQYIREERFVELYEKCQQAFQTAKTASEKAQIACIQSTAVMLLTEKNRYEKTMLIEMMNEVLDS